MHCATIISQLKELADPDQLAGMARFGINTRNCLGISVANLQKIAKLIGKDHDLAQELWQTGIHEARILAALIDKPQDVTASQMKQWVKEFNSWDLCDLCCLHLFRLTKSARKQAVAWCKCPEEFIKRAGFVMMATLAVHDREAENKLFEDYLKLVYQEAKDERNFVKKAVNWALRQIGKRNRHLNQQAIKLAKKIQKLNSAAAKWIASDALWELQSEAVQERLKV